MRSAVLGMKRRAATGYVTKMNIEQRSRKRTEKRFIMQRSKSSCFREFEKSSKLYSEEGATSNDIHIQHYRDSVPRRSIT